MLMLIVSRTAYVIELPPVLFAVKLSKSMIALLQFCSLVFASLPRSLGPAAVTNCRICFISCKRHTHTMLAPSVHEN